MKKYLLPLLLILCFGFSHLPVEAQSDKYKDKRKKQLIRDHMLFNSAQGREFWIAIPPNEIPNYDANVLEIYLATSKTTTATLESPTMGVYLTKEVVPKEITTFSSDKNETTFQWEIRESERITDKGLRITSGQPISIYVLNAKTYTSEGYLAIPLSAWGTDYIHNSYYDFNEVREWAGGFIVISAYENTKIRIELRGKGAGYATTFAGADIGDILSPARMQPGQTFMVRGDGKTRGQFDLSGSRITASQPIGLISFHMRTIIPSYDISNGRDCLSEMIPPVHSWGKKYSTVEYKRDKGKGDFFRVIASEPNTTFKCKYYDLAENKQLGTWEQTLPNPGDFAEWLEAPVQAGHDLKSIRGTSVFEADKPVLVMQYSYSEQWDGATVFDPFMILVVPVEQFIPATVFQTPSNKSFQDNFFNIIAVSDTSDPTKADLKSVTIDDQPIWVADPTFLFNQIPETNLFWAKVRVLPGAHYVKGDTKFGGYIYGFSNWDSYGWPAAMAINKLDETDTLEPVIEIIGECLDYTVHTTELRNGEDGDDPKQVDQGIADIQLLDESYNFEIIFDEPFKAWPPNYDYTFRLQVPDKWLSGFALLAITDRAGNVGLDSVIYVPDSLTLDPEELAFGDVRLKTTKTITAKLTNVTDSSILVKKIELRKGDYYTIESGEAPPEFQLPPGATHDIEIMYSPTRESIREDDLDLDSIFVETECLEYLWPINGRGIIPRIEVDDFHAGAQGVGSRFCKFNNSGIPFEIRNTGSMELIITEIVGVEPPFALSDPTDPPLPISIPPFSSVTLKEMCFNSNDTEDHAIVVTFKSNADPEDSDSLSDWTGSGLTPGPHITSVNWMERRVKTVNDSMVYITNTGNFPIYITDVTLADPTNPNFIVDVANASPRLPVELHELGSDNGQDTIIAVPVRFVPQDIGNKNVEIRAMTDVDQTFPDGIAATGLLEGTGILPVIEVTGWEFTPDQLVGEEHPQLGYITIRSTSTNADLHIKGIDWSSSSQHPNDFYWDPVLLPDGPVQDTILPMMNGEYKIPVRFKPTGVFDRSAIVDVISDAAEGPDTDPSITTPGTVEGVGFETGIIVDSVDFGDVLLCDTPIRSINIQNTSSSTPAVIERMEVVDGHGYLFNILQAFPLTLTPGEKREINVRFSPDNTGPFSALLRVYSDADDKDEHYVLLTGVGYTVPVDIYLPVIPNALVGEFTGDLFKVRAESDEWADANITHFEVSITFNYRWMDWREKDNNGDVFNIKGAILDNTWTVKGEKTFDSNTELTTVKFIGDGTTPIGGNGNLIIPVFELMLSDGTKILPEITEISFGDRDDCVIRTGHPGELAFNICVRDIRNAVFTNTDYALQAVEPNPVGGDVFTLNYSVGFDGNTEITLYNSTSTPIMEMVDEFTKTGHHEKEIDISDLPSGVYFIRMNSGYFSGMQRLVISR